MYSTDRVPDEKEFLWVIDPKELQRLDSTHLKWEILDRGKYFKDSYSKLFKIINIKKGYIGSDRSGDLWLLRVKRVD